MNTSNANTHRDFRRPARESRDDDDAPDTELDVLRRALSRRARELADEDVEIERAFVALRAN